MKKKQSNYTEEFRRESVRLLESSDKTVPELARELGINEKSLYRWRSQYGSLATSKATTQRTENAELEAELKRLQRENEIL